MQRKFIVDIFKDIYIYVKEHVFPDLNVLSWSSNNHIAVALGQLVYLWNAGNGSITQLMELENPEEYVCSLAWIKEGNIVGVGKSDGTVQV